MRGAPWSQFNFNLTALRSGNVNYNPAAGQIPSLLNQETVQLLFTVQPVRQLTADNTYLLDRDHAVANGAFVYEAQTMRSVVNYQFTRSISARLVAEYDSTLANPAETSLLRSKEFASQALLTWLPHPGTAVYIGYSNDLQNLDRSLCNRLPGGAMRSEQYHPASRRTHAQRRPADLYQGFVSLPLLNPARALFFLPPMRRLQLNDIAFRARRRFTR